MKAATKTKHAGFDWLRDYRPNASDLGRKAADLLGELYQGIYHISDEVLHRRVDWSHPYWVEVTVSDANFSTFDGCKLTHLVLLCHAFSIRCELKGAANGYVRLCFSPRIALDEKPDGRFYEVHPNFEQHVERFVKAYRGDK